MNKRWNNERLGGVSKDCFQKSSSLIVISSYFKKELSVKATVKTFVVAFDYLLMYFFLPPHT